MTATVTRTGFIRVEVRLPTPVSLTELRQALDLVFSEAQKDYGAAVTLDAVTVHTDDNVIVLWYQRPYRPSDGIDKNIQ